MPVEPSLSVCPTFSGAALEGNNPLGASGSAEWTKQAGYRPFDTSAEWHGRPAEVMGL